MSSIAGFAFLVLVLMTGMVGGCTQPDPGLVYQVLKDPLDALKAGNKRFVTGTSVHPNADGRRRTHTTKYGVKPFATVIACSDSRVPVELIFDRGIGDLVVIRVMGGVCRTNEVATVEYAVERWKTPIVVVLGHHDCRAVWGATHGTRMRGAFLDIVEHLKPAAEKTRAENPDLRGEKLVALVTEAVVWQTIEELLAGSEIFKRKVAAKGVQLVGAIYDAKTGQVEWLGPHPNEFELVTAGD